MIVSSPWAKRRLAAAAISSSISTFMPVRMASSVSFGVRKLARRTLSMSRSRTAGAGLSTVFAVPLAEGEGGVDRVERHFELQQDQVAGRKIVAAASTSAGVRSPLAPLTMRMKFSPEALTRIVAVPVDWPATRRRASRRRRWPEVVEHALAEHVVADLRHHHDLCAELRRGDGLIGALAAMAHLEARRGDGLAPDRHALDIGDESTLLEPTTPMRGILLMLAPAGNPMSSCRAPGAFSPLPCSCLSHPVPPTAPRD